MRQKKTNLELDELMQDMDPIFPPLLASRPVRAPNRPFENACNDAMQGKAGAGDVYWAQNTRVLDCAIVLEPEVPLAQALQKIGRASCRERV